jgi:hypothetical protein
VPDFHHALGDAVVGDEHIRPDRGHEFVARDEAPGLFGKVAQHVERFRPQRQLGPVPSTQDAARRIQHETAEGECRRS